MNFLCKCGYRIYDNSDSLSYKGIVIADQDQNEFWSIIEKANEPHSEQLDISSKMYNLIKRTIYQCPSCGRLFLEDNSDHYRLLMFTPCIEGEPIPDVNKNMLISSRGEKWRGYLYADWYDTKKEWLEHNGIICPEVNVQFDDLEFDDYELFEKRFFEIFEELKKKDIVDHALMRVNSKEVFNWRRSE